MEVYEKIVRLITTSSEGLQRFAAKREILNRTRMTWIFTDNRICVAGNRQNSITLLKLFPSCETNVVIPSTSNACLTDEEEDFKPLEFERFRSEVQADTDVSI